MYHTIIPMYIVTVGFRHTEQHFILFQVYLLMCQFSAWLQITNHSLLKRVTYTWRMNSVATASHIVVKF